MSEVIQDGIGHKFIIVFLYKNNEYGIVENQIFILACSFVDDLERKDEGFGEMVDYFVHLLFGEFCIDFFHVEINVIWFFIIFSEWIFGLDILHFIFKSLITFNLFLTLV